MSLRRVATGRATAGAAAGAAPPGPPAGVGAAAPAAAASDGHGTAQVDSGADLRADSDRRGDHLAGPGRAGIRVAELSNDVAVGIDRHQHWGRQQLDARL